MIFLFSLFCLFFSSPLFPLSFTVKDKLATIAEKELSLYEPKSFQPKEIISQFCQICQKYTGQKNTTFLINVKKDPQFIASSTPVIHHYVQLKKFLLNRLKSLSLPHDYEQLLIVNMFDRFCLEDLEPSLPIFTFSRTEKEKAVLLPDYEATNGYALDLLDTWDAPWESKLPKALFRGASNASFRIHVANWDQSSRFFLAYADHQGILGPHIDVGLTKWIPWSFEDKALDVVSRIIPLKPFMPWKKQLRYRTLIGLDGVTYGFKREAYVLSSNSLLLRQKTPYFGWYHPLFEEKKHFLSFDAKNIWDLKEKVNWTRENPKQAKKIADASKHLARQVFSEEGIDYYYESLLKRYAEHFSQKERISPIERLQAAKCCPRI